MRKLIKPLKPFIWLILVIFILLYAQAMADLSLPGYMADIVNIGIQQNGIDNAVPQAIESVEYEKLSLFMTEQEKTSVDSGYMLLERQTLDESKYQEYLEEYPALADTPVYELTAETTEEIDELDIIFSTIIPIVSGIEQQGLGAYGDGDMEIPEDVDPFTLITQMPADRIEEIRTTATQLISNLPEGLKEQATIAYIATRYEAIGLDTGGVQTGYILRIGLLMLLITLGSAAASVAVGFLSARVAAAMGRNVRRQLFEKVESFSSAELDRLSTASLITRSTNDITQIQMLMVMLFRVVFYAPILGVGGVIKVIGADESMIWIIAAAVGLVLTLIIILIIVAVPKFQTIQTFIDKLNLVTREILSGLMVIRAFNTQEHEEKRFDVANADLTKVNLFINRVLVFLMPALMLIMNGVMLLIIWVGARQIDAGSIQVGDIMAFMQYAMQIIMAFLMVSMVFIMLPRAIVSAVRISEVLETDPVIVDPKQPQELLPEKKGVVEFKDVTFRYPGAEDDVLKHITFTAMPGQTTAFIGSTGSGKSTLINLIPRFYDVTGGEISVDGVDVRKASQHDLRDRIGYVPQKAVLFSGTVESNIRYANEDATDEEVKKYIRTAQAEDFIRSKEDSHSTNIAQGGTNLSGGQKQRLAIARALAKGPEIYIFDDSLSALDYRTDKALRQALKKETADATVLIVTQRVSTVMSADQILVLDDGEVAGIGTHKQLMKDCEVYQEIALSQLSAEELSQ
ncbi:MAG: ABC transporter ATP-binding protein [Dehalococcoidales bacterium]|nr:ABC transporter ATP-binding protein [Dehalococcoidales bacterium]